MFTVCIHNIHMSKQYLIRTDNKRTTEREKNNHNNLSSTVTTLARREYVAHFCWSSLGTRMCFVYQCLIWKHVAVPWKNFKVAKPIWKNVLRKKQRSRKETTSTPLCSGSLSSPPFNWSCKNLRFPNVHLVPVFANWETRCQKFAPNERMELVVCGLGFVALTSKSREWYLITFSKRTFQPK